MHASTFDYSYRNAKSTSRNMKYYAIYLSDTFYYYKLSGILILLVYENSKFLFAFFCNELHPNLKTKFKGFIIAKQTCNL